MHRRRGSEVARPLVRRERTRSVRGLLRVNHAPRRQEDNRNDPGYGMTRSAFRVSIHPKLSELARQNVQSPLSEISWTCWPICRLSTGRAVTAGPYFRSVADSTTKARFGSFDPEPTQKDMPALPMQIKTAARQTLRQNVVKLPLFREAGRRQNAANQKVIEAISGK